MNAAYRSWYLWTTTYLPILTSGKAAASALSSPPVLQSGCPSTTIPARTLLSGRFADSTVKARTCRVPGEGLRNLVWFRFRLSSLCAHQNVRELYRSVQGPLH